MSNSRFSNENLRKIGRILILDANLGNNLVPKQNPKTIQEYLDLREDARELARIQSLLDTLSSDFERGNALMSSTSEIGVSPSGCKTVYRKRTSN